MPSNALGATADDAPGSSSELKTVRLLSSKPASEARRYGATPHRDTGYTHRGHATSAPGAKFWLEPIFRSALLPLQRPNFLLLLVRGPPYLINPIMPPGRAALTPPRFVVHGIFARRRFK